MTSDGLGGTLVLDPPVGGTGDVTLLGQLIAGTSISNGGPSTPQGTSPDPSQLMQTDYSPLVVNRHT